MGITIADTARHAAAVMRNFDFFGAPLAGIVSMHRDLGPADAVSVGMYLQTLLLALTARGLGTCVEVSVLARGNRSRADRPRRLKTGTVLVREYQGERHTVTVVANGFVWREATYASLSAIARAITGTNWNGPRFFGLRIDRETMVLPDAADVPPAALNGRPLGRAAGIKSWRAVAIQRPSGNAAPARPSLGDGEHRA
jgi:Protein of unknown function (DUF2924)